VVLYFAEGDKMIRLATAEDLEKILKIYSVAREFMKQTGNPTQWGENYPPIDIVKEDIKEKRLFVIEEDNEILACFVYFEGIEPIYNRIDGAWQDQTPYGVIHRVANGGKMKGLVKAIREFAPKNKSLRIDTHKDNLVMQHVLEKNGFVKRGTVYLENGEERWGYEAVEQPQ
jgi:hypothetical protein